MIEQQLIAVVKKQGYKQWYGIVHTHLAAWYDEYYAISETQALAMARLNYLGTPVKLECTGLISRHN